MLWLRIGLHAVSRLQRHGCLGLTTNNLPMPKVHSVLLSFISQHTPWFAFRIIKLSNAHHTYTIVMHTAAFKTVTDPHARVIRASLATISEILFFSFQVTR